MSSRDLQSVPPSQQRGPTSTQLAKIERSIRELDYGEVTVVVHQGIVHEVKTLKRERPQ